MLFTKRSLLLKAGAAAVVLGLVAGLGSVAAAAPTAVDRSPGWLSGASGPQAADGSFGAWRGSPVEIGGTWLNSTGVYTLQPGSEWGSHRGAMDVAIVPPSWSGWAAEADGVHDAYFRQMFRTIAKLRDGRATTYIRLWHEYNGNWMTYSVRNASDAADFKTAWNRTARIARAEFPKAKLMLGTAASGGFPVSATYPEDRLVDGMSIDFYNNWAFCTTQQCFDRKIENGGGVNSLADLQRLAKSHGDPIIISEWSNQGQVRGTGEGGGGESPQFIRSWHAWLKANAGSGPGEVLADVQFNLWSDQFEFFDGRTTRVQPETATEYRRVF